MEISKKELIVTMCINFILLLIVAACMIVLKGSYVALCLSLMAIMFILLSTFMAWMTMRQKRIDIENE